MIDTVDFTTPGFVPPVSEREQFFYDHAGWGYHPERETPEEGRLRGARALADAERIGEERGWWRTWEVEEDPMDYDETEGHDQYQCWVLTSELDENDRFGIVGIMGCIDLGPDAQPSRDPYMRVVAAELMLEALS